MGSELEELSGTEADRFEGQRSHDNRIRRAPQLQSVSAACIFLRSASPDGRAGYPMETTPGVHSQGHSVRGDYSD